MDDKSKIIEITKAEYLLLKIAELKLDLLEAGGVDNWEGVSFALEDFNQKRTELVAEHDRRD